MSHIGKHRVRVESWVDGILSVGELFVSGIEAAREQAKKHHSHHSENSDSFNVKIYNDAGELVESTSGNGPDVNATYA